MNATSESLAEPSRREAGWQRILVWDAPVRVFHWLLALCFVGAYLTAESERWRLVHVTLGYTVAGLVGFRLLWGLVGTRHARFADFVRGPRTVVRYLRSLFQGHPDRYVGHNPVGALAIIALIGLAIVVTASGWAADREVAGEWLEDAHEAAASLMLAVVGLHITGALLSSWLHRENLVGAMVSGRKLGAPREAIRKAWYGVAAMVLGAVLAFWWLQWQSAPVTSVPSGPTTGAHASPADKDD